jgi:hypothetical protein
VTIAPATRAGSVPLNGESIRTVPVNQSAGPLLEGCEPLRLISIILISFAWIIRRATRRVNIRQFYDECIGANGG